MNEWKTIFELRWLAVWQRNFAVWRKLMVPAMFGNFGEPVLILAAFGYGLGFFVGTVEGLPYLVFLASGVVASNAMFTSTFEALYSAYTRMSTQHTWDGILTTPLGISDLVVGEAVWAGTKSILSVGPIVIVAAIMGAVADWRALWVLPVALLTGICFGALGLIITALARSYDFFLYYSTLFITPLMLLSGVFFPTQRLPAPLQTVVQWLPLSNTLALARPLMTGHTPQDIWLHCLVLVVYALLGMVVAERLLRRRLLS